jgi:hypothetical protein
MKSSRLVSKKNGDPWPGGPYGRLKTPKLKYGESMANEGAKKKRPTEEFLSGPATAFSRI